jgi:hypothetical protein
MSKKKHVVFVDPEIAVLQARAEEIAQDTDVLTAKIATAANISPEDLTIAALVVARLGEHEAIERIPQPAVRAAALAGIARRTHELIRAEDAANSRRKALARTNARGANDARKPGSGNKERAARNRKRVEAEQRRGRTMAEATRMFGKLSRDHTAPNGFIGRATVAKYWKKDKKPQ